MFLKKLKGKSGEGETDEVLKWIIYIGIVIVVSFAIYRIVGAVA